MGSQNTAKERQSIGRGNGADSGSKATIGCLQTGRPKSAFIMKAFSDGCGGQLFHFHALRRLVKQMEACAVFGILRGGFEIMSMCHQYKKPFFYIDHGYWGRDKTGYRDQSSNFRICRNGTHQRVLKDRPTDRLEKAGIEFKPWKLSGGTVLFVYQSDHWSRVYRSNNWLNQAKKTLEPQMRQMGLTPVIRRKAHAARPVNWDNVAVLVTHSSNMALDAVQRGIPAIVNSSHALASVGATELNLEKIWMGDRVPLYASLSYSHFSTEEIKSGFAWQELPRGE